MHRLIARDRLRHLIAVAKEAVVAIDPQADSASSATFQAGIAASRAAGFLEAFAISHPEHADEMLTEFEALTVLLDDWLVIRLRSATPTQQALPRWLSSRLTRFVQKMVTNAH